MSSTFLTSLLYQALASPYGLALAVSDFTKAQQRLYVTRREAMDPALSELQFRRSPINPEGEIWLIKATGRKTPRVESKTAFTQT